VTFPGAAYTAPGSRWGGSTWTDAGSNLWMFGGQGFDSGVTAQDSTLLNDIWEWVPGPLDNHATAPTNAIAGTYTGMWVWQGGFDTGNHSGIYGTQGVAATGCSTSTTTGCNLPGGRWAAATVTDPAGNVWLFGGQGYDASGNVGFPERTSGCTALVQAVDLDGPIIFQRG